MLDESSSSSIGIMAKSGFLTCRLGTTAKSQTLLLQCCPDPQSHSRRLIEEGQSVREVARVLNCHHSTLYRHIG
jgi:DNA invertase Pin-like site-specific DNA recombinase